MKVLWLLLMFGCYLKRSQASLPCTTPNSEGAQCISLFSCEVLQKALSSGDATAKEFVKASKCDGDFMVCCGTLGNYTTVVSRSPELPKKNLDLKEAIKTEEGRREYVLKRVFPTLDYCGLQHSDDYYLENKENNTWIDEFPWIVHIDYPGQYLYLHPTAGTEFKCVGVLITNSLVLTSSTCGTYMWVTVKIGQYHKRNTTSCLESSTYGEECTDPVIEVQGNLRDIPNTNLVLVRLPKRINFSDYVRPICLPLDGSHRAKAGDTVYTSGWGEEDIKGSTIAIKKKITHKLKANTNGEGSKTVNFEKNEISNYNVCEGDQGGPLMYHSGKRHQWFLTGIVNSTPCNSTKPVEAIRITAAVIDAMIDPIFFHVYQGN